MKKWKIVLILIPTLGFLSFAAYIVILLLNPSSIIPGNSVAYHAQEELSDLYWQNRDLLNTVKEDVLSNQKLVQAMNEERDGDIGIYIKEDKQYFTEDEWADIVSVFEKFHPYMIVMERKGRPLIFYIVFGSLKQDSVEKSTYLYWFPNEEEKIYHEKPGVFPNGVFTQIDGGWYIVEETDDR